MAEIEKQRETGIIASPEAAGTGEYEIDLLELFYALLEKAKIIILCGFIGLVIAVCYTQFFVDPVYEASSMLYVINSSDSAINLSDLQLGSYLAQDYQLMFDTWELHEMVARNLDLDYSYDDLKKKVSVSNPANTRALVITVHSTDPKEAVMLSNEYAAVLKRRISVVMATEEPNDMSVALEPVIPISPSKIRNAILGMLVGLLLPAGFYAVRFMMDDKYKTPADIEKYTGLPTFAIVPIQGEEHNSSTNAYYRR